jgi:RNA polymerase sigma-70 factor (ECF subfamily)
MTVLLKAVPDATEHPMDSLSDDDLMRLAALCRKDAFEILVIRHHAFVFGLAARFLGNRQMGRDIAQDVFLALWADRDKYQPKGMFKSYLAAVCLNRCRVTARGMKNQDKRAMRLHSEARGDLGEAADLPLDELLKRERNKEIQERLAMLPKAERAVLIYRFTHDMPLSDIGELTGMPLGTVKSHVSRGLLRIRRMLTKGS